MKETEEVRKEIKKTQTDGQKENILKEIRLDCSYS
jgi:hypothetical protein